MARSSTCADCGSRSAGCYSFRYKVELCQDCSEIHGFCLDGNNETSQDKKLHHSRSFDCLSIHSGDTFISNEELEMFLPDFYQKSGPNTPLVIRREFIVSKYLDKLFTSPSGVNTLLPPNKIGIILKKRSIDPGWRPCYVRLNKRDNILEYFGYKSSKTLPKCSIFMNDVEIFVEQMPGKIGAPTKDGEFYLHLIWNKAQKDRNKHSRLTVFAKQQVVRMMDPKKTEEANVLPHVRNLYFWPTTGTECFQWYFALLSAKFALLNTNTLKTQRHSSPLKPSVSFESNLYCQLDESHKSSPRRSVMVPVTKNEPSAEMSPTEEDSNPLSITDPLFHLPDAPTPNLIHRASCTLPESKPLDFSGSYCIDDMHPHFASCRERPEEISHADEIEDNSIRESTKPELILDSSFYSCRPKANTNPFFSMLGDTPEDEERYVYGDIMESPTGSGKTNPFVPINDVCPITSNDSIYELGPDNPVFEENKQSWISTPVRISGPRTNPMTSVDSCPLDLQPEESTPEPSTGRAPPNETNNWYGSIRADMTLNRKLYFKSGWLSKVGEHRGDKWRARWFTMYNHHLTYSENEFSNFPNGHFRLDSDQMGYNVYFNTPTFHTVRPPTPHTFTITTPTREYHLCALTERELSEWFEVISGVIALAFVLK